MDDEDLEFIVKKVLYTSGLLNIYNRKVSVIRDWYEVTGIRCPDIEIYNEALELALTEYKGGKE